MSFEHKYLKYKQKYLELKAELSKIQTGGSRDNVNTESNILDLEKLTETPSFENTFGMQKGGFLNLINSSESVEQVNVEKSEIESDVEKLTDSLNDLGDTPKFTETEIKANTHQTANVELANTDSANVESANVESANIESENVESENVESQQGGNDLDTSISELDEIFSQLGGHSKKDSDTSSDSSDLSSLSSYEDSSSDFGL